MATGGAFVSKAGTYDAFVLEKNGLEFEAYIVKDTPTEMVIRLTDTGRVLHLEKAVQ